MIRIRCGPNKVGELYERFIVTGEHFCKSKGHEKLDVNTWLPVPAFSKDEKALCFHHELLYEAKILDIRTHGTGQKSTYEYKVHYKGWKNT